MRLQKTASRAAALLAKNPALFCRMMLAKLNTARPMPPLPARKRIGPIAFECDLATHDSAAPMYFGSYALLIVEAMRELLHAGEIFFDVGANVGYLSAIAAGLVGESGQVHSFEPVPAYFEKLRRLALLNPEYSIRPNQCAAGETSGVSTIYVTREPGQSTLVPSYKAAPEIVSTLEVPVVRLDSYIEAQGIDRVALIKIDAEGFELPILRGLQGYFERSRHCPPIICEVAPRAYPLIGRSRDELACFLKTYGYSARDLIDRTTPVDICALDSVEDVLFLAED